MVVVEVKDKKYIYFPYLQLILDYNQQLVELADDFKIKRPLDNMFRDIEKIFLKEESLKKELEDTLYNYKSQNSVDLQACQVNIIHKCNLSCKYCFAGDGTHNKTGRMSGETARKTIDFILDMAGDNQKFRLTIIGGEPLLNLETFKEIIEYGTHKFKDNNKKIHFDATTNGTMFNDRVVNIFNEYGVEFMTSLDSDNKIVNDLLRPSRKKEVSTYDLIMQNLNKYSSALKYDSFHITVTPYNKNISKIAEELYKLGVYHLHFSEVMSDNKDLMFNDNDIEILKDEYGKLADLLVKRILENNETSCYPLMRNLGRLHKRKHLKNRCGVLSKLIAIDSAGNIYPCDMLMWDEYNLGNVERGIDKEKLTGLKKALLDDVKCKDCWARYLCGGECLSEKLWDNEKQKKLRCQLKRHICSLQIFIYDCIVKNNKRFNFEKYQF